MSDDEYGDYDDYEYGDNDDQSDNAYKDDNPSENLDFGEIPLQKKQSVIFVTVEEAHKAIVQRLENTIEMMGLNQDEALILSNHCGWRDDILQEKWLDNPDKIKKEAGLEPISVEPPQEAEELCCPLCFDDLPKSEFSSLKCNHFICNGCWKEYIMDKVTIKEQTFFWKCPWDGCNMVVPESMNLKFIPQDQLPLYTRKLARAYAETNKSVRWCPGPDCVYGIQVDTLGARVINCQCGYIFCFKCGKEDHRPCSCDQAAEWLNKDGATGEWISKHTKLCPKCKNPIEKNQGCNYILCQHPGCKYEFCWLCMGHMPAHKHVNPCNKYQGKGNADAVFGEDKVDPNDQNYDGTDSTANKWQKIGWYWERFKNGDQAIKFAKEIKSNFISGEKDLAYKMNLSILQLEFLTKAAKILLDAKQLLKWSYGYGYFINDPLQRNLFEIIQENIDTFSEEMLMLLEKKFPEAQKDLVDFSAFKDKVLLCTYKLEESIKVFLEKMEDFDLGLNKIG